MSEFPDTGSPSEPEPQRQVSLALTLFAVNTDSEPLQVELTTPENELAPPPPFRDTSDSDCACT
jgi:hypothetical protein